MSNNLKKFIRMLLEDYGSEVYAVEFNSDLTDLPIPEEDKEIIDIFTENLLSRFAIEVSPRCWTIYNKQDIDTSTFLTHDIVNDIWRGCGPNEVGKAFGCQSLGQGEAGRRKAIKFARQYGKSGGFLANFFGYV